MGEQAMLTAFCDKPKIWIDHWHRFIDHLAEGKDAESFFASI
jgi:hypothetical protein